ncbi:hypothetical protein GCM10010103_78820 [Streptomyces paradoxus]
MTTASDDAAKPVPVRVALPADPVLGQPEQEVVARLWRRRQTEAGWVFLVGLPSYRDIENAMIAARKALCSTCPLMEEWQLVGSRGRRRPGAFIASGIRSWTRSIQLTRS